jgi:hypothetical protein
VRHDASPRVKGVGNRVMHQITDVRCVNVGKSKKSSRKIAWVLVGAENASKLGVENSFGLLAENLNIINFTRPLIRGVAGT